VRAHDIAGITAVTGTSTRKLRDPPVAMSSEEEGSKSCKPRVFAEYGKEHVSLMFLNPSPHTGYRGLLQNLINLQVIRRHT